MRFLSSISLAAGRLALSPVVAAGSIPHHNMLTAFTEKCALWYIVSKSLAA
ncbi:hypothetical protein S1OALGB6SA_349 [Olavius algarvensis spirochete endosymbiont]|nr:hypothetical protein S1OALGB6SA_349 [Olavius algarvensis spirochete endosymbiont]